MWSVEGGGVLRVELGDRLDGESVRRLRTLVDPGPLSRRLVLDFRRVRAVEAGAAAELAALRRFVEGPGLELTGLTIGAAAALLHQAVER